jgi:hypothetical protein
MWLQQQQQQMLDGGSSITHLVQQLTAEQVRYMQEADSLGAAAAASDFGVLQPVPSIAPAAAAVADAGATKWTNGSH